MIYMNNRWYKCLYIQPKVAWVGSFKIVFRMKTEIDSERTQSKKNQGWIYFYFYSLAIVSRHV